jgi:tetratricopeptide (TPR) repeat protein
LVSLLKQRKVAAFCCAVMMLAVLFIYALPDNKIIHTYYGSRIRSIDYANLGSAYLDDFATNYKIAGQHRSNGLLQKSAEAYSKAAQLAPNPYLKDLGIVYYNLGRYEDAKNAFTQFLNLKPELNNVNIAKYYLGLLEK